MCFAPSSITEVRPRSLSVERATKEAPAARATWQGSMGASIEPKGVDFVFLPGSLVGEYWPLVRP